MCVCVCVCIYSIYNVYKTSFYYVLLFRQHLGHGNLLRHKKFDLLGNLVW